MFIFRLSRTQNVGLWYSKSSFLDSVAYSDSDFAGFKLDRKSTSSACHLLRNNLISQFSKKQNFVALSTTEAEYVVAALNCSTMVWIKQMVKDFGMQVDYPIVTHCHNTSTINMSKNPVMHAKTKHIEIKYHFLREKVANNEVKLDYVSTKEQLADIFTKPLSKDSFEYLRDKL